MKNAQHKNNEKKLSRRDFLKRTALLSTGLLFGVDSKLESSIDKPVLSKPRIVRAFSPNATFWDYQSDYYFDCINQNVVNEMVLQGVLELVKGDLNPTTMLYNPGDKWAIKINCNNRADQSNEIDATAPVIIAVLRLLIEFFGVEPSDIYVYDASRPISYFRIRNRVPYEINYVENGDPLAKPDPKSAISFRRVPAQYLPYVVSKAQHLINIPLFKDHSLVLATMALKNHFGTTRPGPVFLHNPIHYNLSDLNATSQIRHKTRLVVADALFGVWDGGPHGEPMRWETFPGGPIPNSIFIGFDPVAHESVMIDYLIAEQKYHNIPLLSHFYLHDAMRYHNLGVHEHRNNNSQYNYIDYVELEL